MEVMKNTRVDKICLICNKSFKVPKHRIKTAKFCSLSCKSKYIQKIHPELRKKLPHKFGKNHHNWSGGRFLDKSGYVLLRKTTYPNCNHRGYVIEHRWVMEKHIGRLLETREHVHHINGIKTDNRIENLMLFKNAKDHANYHVSITGLPHN